MVDALFEQGRLNARLAQTPEDLGRVQAMRYRAFVDAAGEGREADRFDAGCQHVMIEQGNALVASFRYRVFADAAAAEASYSATVYNLRPLGTLTGALVEMGRFCTDPALRDPDVIRFAWAILTRIVDRARAKLLFGCSSFEGVDPAPYADAFAILRAAHLGPDKYRPTRRAPEVISLPRAKADTVLARRQMPPLLRSYLDLGGWVSDHAVVDHDMNTLHVFTGVEIDRVPPARARALRQLAGN